MSAKKQQIIEIAIQFVKLQLAGNIIFWGTYLGYFVSDYFFAHPEIWALALASLIAHGLFFVVSRDWVFDDDGVARNRKEVYRFIAFMGFNYLLNILIIAGLESYLGITPYIGQFIAGFFFGIWNYLGLKLWVFTGSRHFLPLVIRKMRS